MDSRYPVALSTLGDHLRVKRLDLRLTQKRLAQELGVDEATVNNEKHRVDNKQTKTGQS